MKLFLKLLFGFIFVFMVVMTTRTTMTEALFTGLAFNPAVVEQFHRSPWAVATMYDAYFGFTTFFCYVAYRERSNLPRVIWFVLIMALGNIAMSLYMLIQLFGLKADEPASAVLARKAA